MKNYLLPLVFATLFTHSVYADSEMKRKDIKTVEDVKEYRATVINKITERLNSGDLAEERANMLEKRIAKLESKPLPTQEQIDCMNQFWKNTGIPTDIVYTGKLVTAFDQLLQEKYFKKDASILLIHSGGLQGNRSVKPGVLLY